MPNRRCCAADTAAELEPTEARSRLAKDDTTLGRAHDEPAIADRDQDQGLEM
ncbi:MAG: hypothetical protein ACTHWO_07470 [Nesterenkonia sp.]